MARAERRLLAAALIDWTGTGLHPAATPPLARRARLRPAGAPRDPPAHSPLALQPD